MNALSSVFNQFGLFVFINSFTEALRLMIDVLEVFWFAQILSAKGVLADNIIGNDFLTFVMYLHFLFCICIYVTFLTMS